MKKDETILSVLMEQIEDKIAVIRNVDEIAMQTWRLCMA